MAKKQPKSDAARKPSFEEALEKLEGIVHQLEEGDTGLDESLAHYERGVKLLSRCYELLQKAERRIELLSGVDADGNPVTTAMDDASVPLDEKARAGRRRSAAPPKERPEPPDDDTDIDQPGNLF